MESVIPKRHYRVLQQQSVLSEAFMMADEKRAKVLKVELETSESAEAVEEAGWELLPYDLLLMVLAFLGTRQLLQVRAVNRQWRDAALDPSLWRSRSLLEKVDDRLCATVLRLAPCVGGLKVNCKVDVGSFDLPSYRVVSLAYSARCAVRELWLSIDRANFGYAAMIVRHQEALGRLRALRLEPPSDDEFDVSAAGRLLDVACSCKGLTTLIFGAKYGIYKWNSSPSKLPTPEETVPASLRELVDYSWLPAPHLAFLLRCHAPTLERLTLHGSIRDVEAVGDLLSRATNLVELRCGPYENMCALLQCTKLAKFTLDVRRSSPAAFRATNVFLRRAASLKTVAFRYFDVYGLEDRQCELLKALASSAHAAAIEKLVFILSHDEGDDEVVLMTEAFVRTFADALPRLSGLTMLQVVGILSSGFLEVLSHAGSAPRLSELLVQPTSTSRLDTFLEPCAHSFMHRADVRRLLEQNALLHVKMLTEDPDCYFREECEFCDRGCHSRLMDIFTNPDDVKKILITLYNHPDGEDCGVAHFDLDNEYTDNEYTLDFSLEAF